MALAEGSRAPGSIRPSFVMVDICASRSKSGRLGSEQYYDASGRSARRSLFRTRDSQGTRAEAHTELLAGADADIGGRRYHSPIIGMSARINARYSHCLALGQCFEPHSKSGFFCHLLLSLRSLGFWRGSRPNSTRHTYTDMRWIWHTRSDAVSGRRERATERPKFSLRGVLRR